MRKFIGFVIFLVLLYIVTYQGIVPLVLKYTQEDMAKQAAEAAATAKDRSGMAITQCRVFGNDRLGVPGGADVDYTAWAVGVDQYLVRFQPQGGPGYSCHIGYMDGEEGDINNWKLLGLTELAGAGEAAP